MGEAAQWGKGEALLPLPDAASVDGVPEPPDQWRSGVRRAAWRGGWLTGWQSAWQAAMVWHQAAEAAGNPAESDAKPRSWAGEGDSMLTYVERDLARMKGLDSGVRGSLAGMARRLAARIDKAGDGISETAFSGLMQQLRTTLMAITEVGSDGTLANALYERLSTPVLDAADAIPPDVGAAGGADSGATGEAVHAVAAGMGGYRAGSGSGGHSARVGVGVFGRHDGRDAPEWKDGTAIPGDDA